MSLSIGLSNGKSSLTPITWGCGCGCEQNDAISVEFRGGVGSEAGMAQDKNCYIVNAVGKSWSCDLVRGWRRLVKVSRSLTPG